MSQFLKTLAEYHYAKEELLDALKAHDLLKVKNALLSKDLIEALSIQVSLPKRLSFFNSNRHGYHKDVAIAKVSNVSFEIICSHSYDEKTKEIIIPCFKLEVFYQGKFSHCFKIGEFCTYRKAVKKANAVAQVLGLVQNS